ncbi:Non-heme 11 kDa protein of cytochrome bc1 complex [Mytilinidion resinicola]|uniref:Cytochrome b-c1 complex subunit 6, mitochondrial n=1 Tax=Mytilinidion resinicola TaxID=574789 RepID=A0A6A6YUP4_9PEZI|nr:Non-heme 11 kDa protein of cytochrome bc1 complex [Mytilinidion resinicola]KAF2812480.1 Non-heme 11 kDa protein of cytochrome bc1 complex [Mytilinidion resinicola]
MGFTDLLSDMWDALSTHPDADAEAPTSGGASTNSPVSGTDEESADEKEVNKSDATDGGDGEQGHKPSGDDEPEEEEEEETVDPKEKLEEECTESKQCSAPKHHYDECVERVTGQIENDGKAKEDCVEEFFHLAHCASACAAPKLWAQLK